MRNRYHAALLIGLLLLYWVVSLRHLDVVPPVYEDEPWQASTAWKLATEGVFGSDMFAGFYGMERHYYGYMPVHPLLLAVTFRTLGLGLFQDRFEPVILGLLVLALTYALGRRLFDEPVGLLALVFLLLVRLTGTTPSQVTGILMIDMARIARYDMAVPVFGLSSLLVYLRGVRANASPGRWFALAGFLAALSGLSHLYGLFWILVLGGLALWDHAGRSRLSAMAVGFGVPWAIYAAYVAAGWPDWVGQTRGYAPRFAVFDPGWYLDNLVREPSRYGPGLGAPGWDYLLRPGFWAALVFWPTALLALLSRVINRGDRSARVPLVSTLVFQVLFGLLIHLKLVNYLVTVLPLASLAVAWAARAMWGWSAQAPGRQWVRWVLAALLLAVVAEGAARIATLDAAAARATPYSEFITQVRSRIPSGSRVLGLQNYWLGLHDLDYRAWPAILWQSQASTALATVALDRLAPDVILIDPRMRAYLQGAPPEDPVPDAILAWIEQRGYVRVAVIEDQTYGVMQILQVER